VDNSRKAKVKVIPITFDFHPYLSNAMLARAGLSEAPHLERGLSSTLGISPSLDKWCQYSSSPAFSFLPDGASPCADVV
jgi:hypothetical protein